MKTLHNIKLQQNPLQKQSCNYKKIFPPFISTDCFANIQQQKEKKNHNQNLWKQTTNNFKAISNCGLLK